MKRPLGAKYALATCVVAPGFEFDDFVLASRAELEPPFLDWQRSSAHDPAGQIVSS